MLCDIPFSVPSVSPEALSSMSVFMIKFSFLRRNPVEVFIIGFLSFFLRRNPSERARGLVWIRTLACGAGDPGFKSQRARQQQQEDSLILFRAWGIFARFNHRACDDMLIY